CISRSVHRENRREEGHVLVFRVTPVHDLFSRPCLAADAIARCEMFGTTGAAFQSIKPEQANDLDTGVTGDNLRGVLTRIFERPYKERRLHKIATVHQGS